MHVEQSQAYDNVSFLSKMFMKYTSAHTGCGEASSESAEVRSEYLVEVFVISVAIIFCRLFLPMSFTVHFTHHVPAKRNAHSALVHEIKPPHALSRNRNYSRTLGLCAPSSEVVLCTGKARSIRRLSCRHIACQLQALRVPAYVSLYRE